MISGRKNSLIGLTITITIAAQAAQAGERFEFYNGVRSLGMGGAGVAVVNDETALLVNPAGLGKLRDYFITVADPEIEGNGNTASIAGSALMDSFDPQVILDTLNDPGNLEKHYHSKLQVFPSIVVPNFGFGLYGRYAMDAEVDATNTNYTLNYFNDYALVFGFNFRLWDGMIKIGATARATNRVEIQRTDIPANSLGLSVSGLASEGVGVGADVGIMLAAPIVWLPTIAAVWRDAGDTSYNLKDGMFTGSVTVPAHTPGTVDAAFALFPILGKKTRMTFTGEYRDVMNVLEEEDSAKKIHGGIEFNFSDAVFVRAGYNQRYWTAGLEFQMLNYQLQAATYGEEIGTVDTNKEDRRYVFKFAFRF